MSFVSKRLALFSVLLGIFFIVTAQEGGLSGAGGCSCEKAGPEETRPAEPEPTKSPTKISPTTPIFETSLEIPCKTSDECPGSHACVAGKCGDPCVAIGLSCPVSGTSCTPDGSHGGVCCPAGKTYDRSKSACSDGSKPACAGGGATRTSCVCKDPATVCKAGDSCDAKAGLCVARVTTPTGEKKPPPPPPPPPPPVGDGVEGALIEYTTTLGRWGGSFQDLGKGNYSGLLYDLDIVGSGDATSRIISDPVYDNLKTQNKTPFNVSTKPTQFKTVVVRQREIYSTDPHVRAVTQLVDADGVPAEGVPVTFAISGGIATKTFKSGVGGIVEGDVAIPFTTFPTSGDKDVTLTVSATDVSSPPPETIKLKMTAPSLILAEGQVGFILPAGPVYTGTTFTVSVQANNQVSGKKEKVSGYDLEIGFSGMSINAAGITIEKGVQGGSFGDIQIKRKGDAGFSCSVTVGGSDSSCIRFISTNPTGEGTLGDRYAELVKINFPVKGTESTAKLQGKKHELTRVHESEPGLGVQGEALQISDFDSVGAAGDLIVLEDRLLGLFAWATDPDLIDASLANPSLKAAGEVKAQAVYSGSGIREISSGATLTASGGSVKPTGGSNYESNGDGDSTLSLTTGIFKADGMKVRSKKLKTGEVKLSAENATLKKIDGFYQRTRVKAEWNGIDLAPWVNFEKTGGLTLDPVYKGWVGTSGTGGTLSILGSSLPIAVAGTTSVKDRSVAIPAGTAMTTGEVKLDRGKKVLEVKSKVTNGMTSFSDRAPVLVWVVTTDGKKFLAGPDAELNLKDNAVVCLYDRSDTKETCQTTITGKQGYLKPTGPGETFVTAKYAGGEAKGKVIIKLAETSGLSIAGADRIARNTSDPAAKILGLDNKTQLKATVAFEAGPSYDATSDSRTKYEVTGDLVTVSPTGLVTATNKGTGKATIKVTVSGLGAKPLAKTYDLWVMSLESLRIDTFEDFDPPGDFASFTPAGDPKKVPDDTFGKIESTTTWQNGRLEIHGVWTDLTEIDLLNPPAASAGYIGSKFSHNAAKFGSFDLLGSPIHRIVPKANQDPIGLTADFSGVGADSKGSVPQAKKTIRIVDAPAQIKTLHVKGTDGISGGKVDGPTTFNNTFSGIKDKGETSLRVIATFADGERRDITPTATGKKINGLLNFTKGDINFAGVKGADSTNFAEWTSVSDGKLKIKGNGAIGMTVGLGMDAAPTLSPQSYTLATNLTPDVGDVDLGEAQGRFVPVLGKGSTYDLQVRVNTGGKKLKGVDIRIFYNDAVVTTDDKDVTLAYADLGKNVRHFPLADAGGDKDKTGQVWITGTLPGDGVVGTDLLLATIRFTAGKVGPTVTRLSGVVLGLKEKAGTDIGTAPPAGGHPFVAGTGDVDPADLFSGDYKVDTRFDVDDLITLQNDLLLGTAKPAGDYSRDGVTTLEDAVRANLILLSLYHIVTVDQTEPVATGTTTLTVTLKNRNVAAGNLIAPVTDKTRNKVILELRCPENPTKCTTVTMTPPTGTDGKWTTPVIDLEYDGTMEVKTAIVVMDDKSPTKEKIRRYLGTRIFKIKGTKGPLPCVVGVTKCSTGTSCLPDLTGTVTACRPVGETCTTSASCGSSALFCDASTKPSPTCRVRAECGAGKPACPVGSVCGASGHCLGGGTCTAATVATDCTSTELCVGGKCTVKNNKPTLTITPTVTEAKPRTKVTLTITGTDPDPGQTVTLSVSPTTIGKLTGDKFEWTPTDADKGKDFKFTFTATDSGSPALTDTREVTIRVVTPVAGSPVKFAPIDFDLLEGALDLWDRNWFDAGTTIEGEYRGKFFKVSSTGEKKVALKVQGSDAKKEGTLKVTSPVAKIYVVPNTSDLFLPPGATEAPLGLFTFFVDSEGRPTDPAPGTSLSFSLGGPTFSGPDKFDRKETGIWFQTLKIPSSFFSTPGSKKLAVSIPSIAGEKNVNIIAPATPLSVPSESAGLQLPQKKMIPGEEFDVDLFVNTGSKNLFGFEVTLTPTGPVTCIGVKKGAAAGKFSDYGTPPTTGPITIASGVEEPIGPGAKLHIATFRFKVTSASGDAGFTGTVGYLKENKTDGSTPSYAVGQSMTVADHAGVAVKTGQVRLIPIDNEGLFAWADESFLIKAPAVDSALTGKSKVNLKLVRTMQTGLVDYVPTTASILTASGTGITIPATGGATDTFEATATGIGSLTVKIGSLPEVTGIKVKTAVFDPATVTVKADDEVLQKIKDKTEFQRTRVRAFWKIPGSDSWIEITDKVTCSVTSPGINLGNCRIGVDPATKTDTTVAVTVSLGSSVLSTPGVPVKTSDADAVTLNSIYVSIPAEVQSVSSTDQPLATMDKPELGAATATGKVVNVLRSFGQQVPLTVWALTSDGKRMEVTDVALLSSVGPGILKITGKSGEAVSKGKTDITATWLGISGSNPVEVDIPVPDTTIEGCNDLAPNTTDIAKEALGLGTETTLGLKRGTESTPVKIDCSVEAGSTFVTVEKVDDNTCKVAVVPGLKAVGPFKIKMDPKGFLGIPPQTCEKSVVTLKDLTFFLYEDYDSGEAGGFAKAVLDPGNKLSQIEAKAGVWQRGRLVGRATWSDGVSRAGKDYLHPERVKAAGSFFFDASAAGANKKDPSSASNWPGYLEIVAKKAGDVIFERKFGGLEVITPFTSTISVRVEDIPVDITNIKLSGRSGSGIDNTASTGGGETFDATFGKIKDQTGLLRGVATFKDGTRYDLLKDDGTQTVSGLLEFSGKEIWFKDDKGADITPVPSPLPQAITIPATAKGELKLEKNGATGIEVKILVDTDAPFVQPPWRLAANLKPGPWQIDLGEEMGRFVGIKGTGPFSIPVRANLPAGSVALKVLELNLHYDPNVIEVTGSPFTPAVSVPTSPSTTAVSSTDTLLTVPVAYDGKIGAGDNQLLGTLNFVSKKTPTLAKKWTTLTGASHLTDTAATPVKHSDTVMAAGTGYIDPAVVLDLAGTAIPFDGRDLSVIIDCANKRPACTPTQKVLSDLNGDGLDAADISWGLQALSRKFYFYDINLVGPTSSTSTTSSYTLKTDLIDKNGTVITSGTKVHFKVIGHSSINEVGLDGGTTKEKDITTPTGGFYQTQLTTKYNDILEISTRYDIDYTVGAVKGVNPILVKKKFTVTGPKGAWFGGTCTSSTTCTPFGKCDIVKGVCIDSCTGIGCPSGSACTPDGKRGGVCCPSGKVYDEPSGKCEGGVDPLCSTSGPTGVDCLCKAGSVSATCKVGTACDSATGTCVGNKPPFFKEPALTKYDVFVGDPVSFKVVAADPDGDTIRLSRTDTGTKGTFDASKGEFGWTPVAADAGPHTLTFKAEDLDPLTGASRGAGTSITVEIKVGDGRVAGDPVAGAHVVFVPLLFGVGDHGLWDGIWWENTGIGSDGKINGLYTGGLINLAFPGKVDLQAEVKDGTTTKREVKQFSVVSEAKRGRLILSRGEVYPDSRSVKVYALVTDDYGRPYRGTKTIQATSTTETVTLNLTPISDKPGIFAGNLEIPPTFFSEDEGNLTIVLKADSLSLKKLDDGAVTETQKLTLKKKVDDLLLPAGFAGMQLPKRPYAPGETFDVPILVNTTGTGITAFKVVVNFDSILELTGVDATAGFDPFAIASFASPITLVTAASSNLTPSSLATLHFRVKTGVALPSTLTALFSGTASELIYKDPTGAQKPLAGNSLALKVSGESGTTADSGTLGLVETRTRGWLAYAKKSQLIGKGDTVTFVKPLPNSLTKSSILLYQVQNNGSLSPVTGFDGITCTDSEKVVTNSCTDFTPLKEGTARITVKKDANEVKNIQVSVHLIEPADVTLLTDDKDGTIKKLKGLSGGTVDAYPKIQAHAVWRRGGWTPRDQMDLTPYTTFTSSDPGVFTVDGNGLITPVGGGSAKLLAYGLETPSLTVFTDAEDFTLETTIPAHVGVDSVTSPVPLEAMDNVALGTTKGRAKVVNTFNDLKDEAPVTIKAITADKSRFDITQEVFNAATAAPPSAVLKFGKAGVVRFQSSPKNILVPATSGKDFTTLDVEFANKEDSKKVAIDILAPPATMTGCENLARSTTDASAKLLGLPISRTLALTYSGGAIPIDKITYVVKKGSDLLKTKTVTGTTVLNDANKIEVQDPLGKGGPFEVELQVNYLGIANQTCRGTVMTLEKITAQTFEDYDPSDLPHYDKTKDGSFADRVADSTLSLIEGQTAEWQRVRLVTEGFWSDGSKIYLGPSEAGDSKLGGNFDITLPTGFVKGGVAGSDKSGWPGSFRLTAPTGASSGIITVKVNAPSAPTTLKPATQSVTVATSTAEKFDGSKTIVRGSHSPISGSATFSQGIDNKPIAALNGDSAFDATLMAFQGAEHPLTVVGQFNDGTRMILASPKGNATKTDLVGFAVTEIKLPKMSSVTSHPQSISMNSLGKVTADRNGASAITIIAGTTGTGTILKIYNLAVNLHPKTGDLDLGPTAGRFVPVLSSGAGPLIPFRLNTGTGALTTFGFEMTYDPQVMRWDMDPTQRILASGINAEVNIVPPNAQDDSYKGTTAKLTVSGSYSGPPLSGIVEVMKLPIKDARKVGKGWFELKGLNVKTIVVTGTTTSTLAMPVAIAATGYVDPGGVKNYADDPDPKATTGIFDPYDIAVLKKDLATGAPEKILTGQYPNAPYKELLGDYNGDGGPSFGPKADSFDLSLALQIDTEKFHFTYLTLTPNGTTGNYLFRARLFDKNGKSVCVKKVTFSAADKGPTGNDITFTPLSPSLDDCNKTDGAERYYEAPVSIKYDSEVALTATVTTTIASKSGTADNPNNVIGRFKASGKDGAAPCGTTTGACGHGMKCDAGSCKFAGGKGAGEFCTTGIECSTGLECVSGTCVSTAGLKKCTTDTECTSPALHCDSIRGFCTPPPEACKFTVCPTGSRCEELSLGTAGCVPACPSATPYYHKPSAKCCTETGGEGTCASASCGGTPSVAPEAGGLCKAVDPKDKAAKLGSGVWGADVKFSASPLGLPTGVVKDAGMKSPADAGLYESGLFGLVRAVMDEAWATTADRGAESNRQKFQVRRDPSFITLGLSREKVYANDTDPVVVTAFVTDAKRAPNQNTEVTFSVPEGKGTFKKAKVNTDANGFAVARFTPAVGSFDGTPPASFDVTAEVKLTSTTSVKTAKKIEPQPRPTAPSHTMPYVWAELPFGPRITGSSFTVPIYVDTRGGSLESFNLRFAFEKAQLEFVSVAPSQTALSTTFTSNSDPNTDDYVGFTASASSPLSGLVKIAEITFKSKMAGDIGGLQKGTIFELGTLSKSPQAWAHTSTGAVDISKGSANLKVEAPALKQIYGWAKDAQLIDEPSTPIETRGLMSDGNLAAGPVAPPLTSGEGTVAKPSGCLTCDAATVHTEKLTPTSLKILLADPDDRLEVRCTASDGCKIPKKSRYFVRATYLVDGGNLERDVTDRATLTASPPDAVTIDTIDTTKRTIAAAGTSKGKITLTATFAGKTATKEVSVSLITSVNLTNLHIVVPARTTLDPVAEVPTTSQTAHLKANVTNAMTSLGQEVPVRVLGFFSDGSWEDLTDELKGTLKSDNTAVATLLEGEKIGSIKATGPGKATATASYRESDKITITGSSLVEVILPPADIVVTKADGKTALKLGEHIKIALNKDDPAVALRDDVAVEQPIRVFTCFAAGVTDPSASGCEEVTLDKAVYDDTSGDTKDLFSVATVDDKKIIRSKGTKTGAATLRIKVPTFTAGVRDVPVDIVAMTGITGKACAPHPDTECSGSGLVNLWKIENLSLYQWARLWVFAQFSDGDSFRVDLLKRKEEKTAILFNISTVGGFLSLEPTRLARINNAIVRGAIPGSGEVKVSYGIDPDKTPWKQSIKLAVKGDSAQITDLLIGGSALKPGATSVDKTLSLIKGEKGNAEIIGKFNQDSGYQAILVYEQEIGDKRIEVPKLLEITSTDIKKSAYSGQYTSGEKYAEVNKDSGTVTARGNGAINYSVKVVPVTTPFSKATKIAVNLLPKVGDVDIGDEVGVAFKDQTTAFTLPVRINTGENSLGSITLKIRYKKGVLKAGTLPAVEGSGVSGYTFSAGTDSAGDEEIITITRGLIVGKPPVKGNLHLATLNLVPIKGTTHITRISGTIVSFTQPDGMVIGASGSAIEAGAGDIDPFTGPRGNIKNLSDQDGSTAKPFSFAGDDILLMRQTLVASATKTVPGSSCVSPQSIPGVVPADRADDVLRWVDFNRDGCIDSQDPGVGEAIITNNAFFVDIDLLLPKVQVKLFKANSDKPVTNAEATVSVSGTSEVSASFDAASGLFTSDLTGKLPPSPTTPIKITVSGLKDDGKSVKGTPRVYLRTTTTSSPVCPPDKPYHVTKKMCCTTLGFACVDPTCPSGMIFNPVSGFCEVPKACTDHTACTGGMVCDKTGTSGICKMAKCGGTGSALCPTGSLCGPDEFCSSCSFGTKLTDGSCKSCNPLTDSSCVGSCPSGLVYVGGKGCMAPSCPSETKDDQWDPGDKDFNLEKIKPWLVPGGMPGTTKIYFVSPGGIDVEPTWTLNRPGQSIKKAVGAAADFIQGGACAFAASAGTPCKAYIMVLQGTYNEEAIPLPPWTKVLGGFRQDGACLKREVKKAPAKKEWMTRVITKECKAGGIFQIEGTTSGSGVISTSSLIDGFSLFPDRPPAVTGGIKCRGITIKQASPTISNSQIMGVVNNNSDPDFDAAIGIEIVGDSSPIIQNNDIYGACRTATSSNPCPEPLSGGRVAMSTAISIVPQSPFLTTKAISPIIRNNLIDGGFSTTGSAGISAVEFGPIDISFISPRLGVTIAENTIKGGSADGGVGVKTYGIDIRSPRFSGLGPSPLPSIVISRNTILGTGDATEDFTGIRWDTTPRTIAVTGGWDWTTMNSLGFNSSRPRAIANNVIAVTKGTTDTCYGIDYEGGEVSILQNTIDVDCSNRSYGIWLGYEAGVIDSSGTTVLQNPPPPIFNNILTSLWGWAVGCSKVITDETTVSANINTNLLISNSSASGGDTGCMAKIVATVTGFNIVRSSSLPALDNSKTFVGRSARNYYLKVGSDPIDKGILGHTNSYTPLLDDPIRDRVGLFRLFQGGASYDLGACEFRTDSFTNPCPADIMPPPAPITPSTPSSGSSPSGETPAPPPSDSGMPAPSGGSSPPSSIDTLSPMLAPSTDSLSPSVAPEVAPIDLALASLASAGQAAGQAPGP